VAFGVRFLHSASFTTATVSCCWNFSDTHNHSNNTYNTPQRHALSTTCYPDCRVLQCVAMCCSVLQCVAVTIHTTPQKDTSYTQHAMSMLQVATLVLSFTSKGPCILLCQRALYFISKKPYFLGQKTPPFYIKTSPVSSRVAKIRRIPYLHKSFSAKEPYILQKSPISSGSFANRNQQLTASYASSPPCTSKEPCFLSQKTPLFKSLYQKGPVSCVKRPLCSISKEPCIMRQKTPLFYIKRALYPASLHALISCSNRMQ